MSNWLLIDIETGTLRSDIQAGRRTASSHSFTSEAMITDDAWRRIGLVWDGTERRIYVDGDMVAADVPMGLSGSMNGLNIGCSKDFEQGTFWSGLIDDVQVFTQAIDP